MLTNSVVLATDFHCLIFFVLQRSGTRRRYQDDGISDDEIDGKRTFDLEEKLHSSRFSSDRVKRMEGKGDKELQFLWIHLYGVCNLTWPVFFRPHI